MTPTAPFESDPAQLDAVRDCFYGDTFAHDGAGIQIEAAAENHALVSMPIRESLLNAKGIVQGGALFTLADVAGGVADYRASEVNTTVDASIQYLTPAKGEVVYAHAYATRRGRSIGYYRVDLFDDVDTQVGVAQFTYMHWPIDH